MRIATTIALALLAGCGDDAQNPVDPPPAPRPTTLSVTPDTATFATLGDSLQLTAHVADQFGQSMDVPVTWSSSDPAVASVSAFGWVTATGNGVADIRASAGSVSDAAAVVVDDPIAAEYAPDREALTAFFNQANGPQWTDNSGWGEDGVPMEEWYGVTVAFDSAVGLYRPERLHLVNNNLRGNMVPEKLGGIT